MAGRVLTKKIRGLQTAWFQDGPDDGPILFFVHGYPDTPETFSRQYEHFRDRFQIIAPYTRGARPSSQAEDIERYSHTATALDHLAILKEVDPGRRRPIYLVGHDLGGPQIWELAPMISPQLKGLVMLNTMSIRQFLRRLATRPDQIIRSWYMLGMQIAPLADRALRRFPGKLLRFAHRYGKLDPKDRPQLAQTLPGILHPAKRYRAYLRDLPKFLTKKEHRLTSPVLVLWGRDDRTLSVPTRDEFACDASDVTIRIIEGGHWIHREHSETVNYLMEEFLCQSV